MAKEAPLKKKSVNLSGRRFLLRLGSMRMEPALLLEDAMDCDMVLFLVTGVFSGSGVRPLSSSFMVMVGRLVCFIPGSSCRQLLTGTITARN